MGKGLNTEASLQVQKPACQVYMSIIETQRTALLRAVTSTNDMSLGHANLDQFSGGYAFAQPKNHTAMRKSEMGPGHLCGLGTSR